MSDFHSEDTLRDKPDCGVIDPAWCKGQGQNYPIPCKKMIITLYNKDLWKRLVNIKAMQMITLF